MVRISKNGTSLLVSKGAFNNFFKRSGWSLDEESKSVQAKFVDKESKAPKQESSPVEDENLTSEETDAPEDESTKVSDDEVLEIPLADMTSRQMRQAARVIGFDYKAAGINTSKDLRKALKEKLQKEV